MLRLAKSRPSSGSTASDFPCPGYLGHLFGKQGSLRRSDVGGRRSERESMTETLVLERILQVARTRVYCKGESKRWEQGFVHGGSK